MWYVSNLNILGGNKLFGVMVMWGVGNLAGALPPMFYYDVIGGCGLANYSPCKRIWHCTNACISQGSTRSTQHTEQASCITVILCLHGNYSSRVQAL